MAKKQSYISSKRFKIIPIDKDGLINKESYSFIRESMYAQSQALNIGMGYTVSTYYKYNKDFKNEKFKQEIKDFKYNLSNPVFNDINFGKGIDTLSAVHQKVKKDFSTALKNGLAKGERSCTNYKRDFPLLTRGRDIRFFVNEKDEVFIKWVNGIIFKVILSRKKHRSYIELQSVIQNILNNTYKLGQGQVFFDKNKELFIDISIDMTNKVLENKVKIIDHRVMGIDLGVSIPAYVVIEDNPYLNKAFGNKFELLKTKTQFEQRRNRVQKQLELAKGGKGRKDKLSAYDSLRQKERNWTKTYNHQLTKKIIDYAVKHKVTQINLEKLTKEGFSDRLLGKWCYYELQQMIIYKAERVGIIVKFVNPAYTSQTCSCCGNVDKENRKNQETFLCTKCGFKENADYNAGLNISRSTNYVSNKIDEIEE